MQAGTRFTYPGGTEGWVDLVGLIAPRPGVEPATFRSPVQRRSAAHQDNHSYITFNRQQTSSNMNITHVTMNTHHSSATSCFSTSRRRCPTHTNTQTTYPRLHSSTARLMLHSLNYHIIKYNTTYQCLNINTHEMVLHLVRKLCSNICKLQLHKLLLPPGLY